MIKAVVDRFEGDIAVLLTGDNEERKDVPRKILPKKVKEGHWLQVEIQSGEVIKAIIDENDTTKAKQRISEKLARLRKGDQLKNDG